MGDSGEGFSLGLVGASRYEPVDPGEYSIRGSVRAEAPVGIELDGPPETGLWISYLDLPSGVPGNASAEWSSADVDIRVRFQLDTLVYVIAGSFVSRVTGMNPQTCVADEVAFFPAGSDVQFDVAAGAQYLSIQLGEASI